MEHRPAASLSDRQRRIPRLDSIVLGAGPFALIVASALGVLLSSASTARIILPLLIAWSAAILAFVAGVRRGLSFDVRGGAPLGAIVASLVLFTFAFAGLVLRDQRACLVILACGYALLGVLDWRAARLGDAPRFFAMLRPLQAGVAALSLIIVLAAGL